MSKFNVEFTDKADALIERLCGLLDTTKVGVLRYGLTLVALAAREELDGNALGVVKGKEVVKGFAPPWTPLRFPDPAEPLAKAV